MYYSLLGVQGAKGRLARAEQAFEALLDAQLRCRQHDPEEDGCSGSEGFPADLQDDYIDSDAGDIDSDADERQQADQSLQAQNPTRQAQRAAGAEVQQVQAGAVQPSSRFGSLLLMTATPQASVNWT